MIAALMGFGPVPPTPKVAPAAGPAVIVFARHGETVANATGRYNSRTLNTFSETGKAQVARLTTWLRQQPKFDAILVSPSDRALNSVRPYLLGTRQTARVWPEWYECCTGRNKSTAGKGNVRWGGKITLGSPFVVERGHDRYPVSPKFVDGLVQVRMGVDRLAALRTLPRVLIVGHSGAGGVMMEMLEGASPRGRKHPENATPYQLNRQADGTYRSQRIRI
ncbi:MAG: histidine phosphatase family protein [Fimbriimonadaceae bacterium]|nr:histidine phosphatase family protein [Fimbriimonadaceae bacterium]